MGKLVSRKRDPTLPTLHPEVRMAEMASMGVGSKVFWDITPSEEAINNRTIDYVLKCQGSRVRVGEAKKAVGVPMPRLAWLRELWPVPISPPLSHRSSLTGLHCSGPIGLGQPLPGGLQPPSWRPCLSLSAGAPQPALAQRPNAPGPALVPVLTQLSRGG